MKKPRRRRKVSLTVRGHVPVTTEDLAPQRRAIVHLVVEVSIPSPSSIPREDLAWAAEQIERTIEGDTQALINKLKKTTPPSWLVKGVMSFGGKAKLS
jgi:hypothetical protein